MAHDNIATNNQRSPLLRSRLISLPKSNRVTIVATPVIDNMRPKIWLKFIFSVLKINEIKIINTGIIEIINAPFRTCVKFKE
jgi:hypothetical protein